MHCERKVRRVRALQTAVLQMGSAMQKQSQRRRLASSVPHGLLVAAMAAGGVLGFGGQASAQNNTSSSDQDQTIVVTGSRIHTDPLTNRQPVTQLSEDDIART